jgi:uncharacterized protein (TIGR02145 family)
MKNWLILILIAFTLFSSDILSQISNPIQTQRRIALLIGNGNYSTSVLANPENDARAMAVVLKKLGFVVYKYENLNQGQIKKAIDEFGANLRYNDVALFYYAGHGIQSNGYNYLIPVDAQLATEKQVEYDCVQADRMLAVMEGSGTKVNIIILDACRNNPFERSWTRSNTGKGLAFMNAPIGTLIAYATSPGSTALDGSGENGLYTSAILESILIPNITILQMFQQVRSIVSQKSNDKQTPWESTSLIGDFYFNPERIVNPAIRDIKQATPIVALPTISTFEISNISSTGASSYVTITNDGGDSVSERGVCWSTTSNPTTSNSKTTDSTGIGSFSSRITNLTPGITYYVRAYATNSAGTEYSNQVSFITILSKPTILTTSISSITSNATLSGGNIISNGGETILVRGVCWNTSANPTTANNKTTDGSGTGKFTSSITGLSPNTTYYLRAYSTNNSETNYGNEISFKTHDLGQFTDIDENIYTMSTFGNQTWMLENLKTTKYNDGTLIPLIKDKTEWSNLKTPGYCWYNNDEATHKVTYGALYNWYAINTGKLCPTGWHIPSDAEWKTLTTYLGRMNAVGGKLKESDTTNWKMPNTSATKESGFTAPPGGYRFYNGEFNYLDKCVYWWSSTENSTCDVWNRYMNSNNYRLFSHKTDGFSVRCVKDF